MATLNTLRTKFGIVLSAVIAFALLAFIFSLKSEMGFSGSDPVVAKINGENVNYTEYQAKYDQIRSQNNIDESNEEQLSALANATLQSFVTSRVLTPGFEKMGINVSEAERRAIISGEIPTQAFYGAFADPSTGVYDAASVAMFLTQANGNAQAEAAWTFLNEQAFIEREGSKYLALLSGGAYANALETKSALASSNQSYDGRWASVRYSQLPDSLYAVSSSEVNKYYENNKANYKKSPTRTISYVAFDILPTEEDKATLQSTVAQVGVDFSDAEDIRTFVRDNRYGNIATNFVVASQLIADETAAFEAGDQYGPILSNDKWRMSRVFERRMAPDSVGVRLIVLPYTSQDLADSLVTAIKGGESFAVAAAQNSMHQQSAQMGGEIGVLPYSAFTTEMADALAKAKEGDVVKIEVGDMIQILQSYNVGKSVPQYRVASIEYPVVPSQATINKAHGDAGLFAVDAKGSVSKFDNAVSSHSVSPLMAEIAQGDRQFRSIDSSRELARWAYGAKVGDLSDIIKIEDRYIVAVLASIDNSEYSSLESVSNTIATELRNEKKFDALSAKISGATFDEQLKSMGDANDGAFENVNFASYYIQGVGVEPRLVGAIASTTEANKVSAPVAGNTALYIFEVSSIEANEEPLTEDAVKVRLQATAESTAQQVVLPVINEMAKIEDLRGMYF
ncbi:MAG: peptidylprolyl isomerase [Rikenellaceae bacterium]